MPRPRDPDDPRFALPSTGPSGLERAIRWGLVAVAVAVAVWTYPHWPNAWRWITGREPLFIPEHEPNLDGIDLEAVHRSLLPEFIIAASHAIPETPDERLEKARTAMRDAVGPDANLTQLFDELDGIVTSDRLRGKGPARRSIWLGRAWNHYLDEQGYDYYVHPNVLEGSRPMFYAHIYRVVGDSTGTVGDESLRVRAVSRLDPLNLKEAYLGFASNEDEGAVIIADRVVEFALDRIWPLLDERGGDRLAQVFAPMVVAEVRRDLPSEAFKALSETAAGRRALIAAYDGIRDRRGCSRMWIPRAPWSGYDREQLDQLSGFVEVGRCAAVRDHELTAMWRASEAFEAKQGLKEAAEYLTAWVARSVAVHELRHVSDDMQYDDDDDKRPCGPCVSSDPKVVRSEAAAYVAELAWTKAPAAALYQICVATAGGQGAHARAREVVMQGLRSNCSDGVPPEITEAARTLEAEAFDHPEPIELGEGFVTRLPVVSARDQGVAGTEEP